MIRTSVIGWHEISRLRMVAIIAFWLLAVGIYAWDYRIGFAVLLTLSLGHVILEFPLNHQTIWEIGKELGKRFRGNTRVPQESGLPP